MIETYAEVRGHELTTRQDLMRSEPDHPRAKEEYYKVEIGPLLNLQQPIKSERWTRINFFYSLGNLVNQARIINDLVVKTDEREILWKTIREKSRHDYASQRKSAQAIPEMELNKLLDLIVELNSGVNWEEAFHTDNEIEQE